ncbi:MAG: hypothetical protein HGA85_06835 [Nanoarchaeota archaeon]|nr:hypothetical protein [Nanoarchaeota archaeon]
MEDFDDITDKGNPNELSMLYWATSANREAGKEIIHIEKIDGRNVYTPTKDLFSIIEKTPLERDVGLISHFTRFSSSYGLANALVMIYEATGRSISVLYENLESIGMPKPEFVEHLSFPVNINTLGAWAAANENKIYEHSVKCIKESPYVHGVIPLDRWVELNKADLHPNLAAHLYPSK